MRSPSAFRAFSLVLLVAAGGQAQQTLQEQIVAQERAELDTLKTGDMKVFASLLAEEAVFLDAHGSAGKAEVVKNSAEVRLRDYTMSEVKFVPVSADTGLIVYKLVETGSSHGKDFSAKVNVSALWTKHSGKWLCLFSQETAAR